MHHKTPISLLDRLRQAPGADAWRRFVQLYTPLLFHWSLRAGVRAEDVDDLVQEVLMTLVKRLPDFSYDRQGSFRAWLRTVTLNHYRNSRKKQARGGLAKGDMDVNDLPAPDSTLFEEKEYRQYMLHRALQVIEADFQPRTWQACWMHVAEGRSAPEVAAELGMTIGSVYAARIRVLDRLRTELAGLMD